MKEIIGSGFTCTATLNFGASIIRETTASGSDASSQGAQTCSARVTSHTGSKIIEDACCIVCCNISRALLSHSDFGDEERSPEDEVDTNHDDAKDPKLCEGSPIHKESPGTCLLCGTGLAFHKIEIRLGSL